MSVLKLKLFGQIECRRPSGKLVKLPTRKAEVLLAYLALSPDVKSPRDRLTNLLWSDRGEDQARNSLRQSLSQIKKALGKDSSEALEVDRNTVSLTNGGIEVDVLRFESMIDQPDQENLSKAVALYQNEFLQGMSVRDKVCEEWINGERDRLRRLAVAALTSLSQLQVAESNFEAAIESVERLVVYDPLQESGWRLLMAAYYLNGDRNHGLLAYKRCRKILQLELGVEPDKKTRDLYQQLKQDEFDSANSEITDSSILHAEQTDLRSIYSDQYVSGQMSDEEIVVGFSKPTGNIRSCDYFMQGWRHADYFNPRDAAIAIEQFQKCVEIDPHHADAHAVLSAEYNVLLYENWSTYRKQTLKQSRYHVERAMELDPDNALNHAFMSEYLLFERDYERAEFHADRAMELDPNLPDSCSMKAVVYAMAGRFDEAVKYAEMSLQIIPNHPYAGWNAGEVFLGAGDYDRALKTFRSIPDLPNCLRAEIAVCLKCLGRHEEARAEMRHYHELARRQMPTYPASQQEWYSLWRDNLPYRSDEDYDRFFGLLLSAGLCEDFPQADSELPSIAVLPFEIITGEPDHEYISDGIASDIISILSRIKGIRVVARHSLQQYRNEETTLEEIAEQQNVRYILVGNIRTSKHKIRVNAELVDSFTAENCWVEQYERDLEDIFAVQDDIVKNITVAMQVRFSGGERDRQRARGTGNINAWVNCLAATDLQDSYIKDNVMEARRLAQSALQLDSAYTYAWVILGWTHWQEIYCGWSASVEDSLAEAERAAQTALELDPGNAEVWALCGLIHVMRHQSEQAIEACQRAVELEPGNAEAHALLACALCPAGMYEKARINYETSLRLSPVHPGWYLLAGGIVDLLSGQIDEAIAKFKQGIDIVPSSPLCRFYLVDALMEAGDAEGAEAVAREITALDESFGISGLVRVHHYDAAVRDRFRQNLLRAGLSE